MNDSALKNTYLQTVIYAVCALLLGLSVVFLPLNEIECGLVRDLQDFARRTNMLQALWVLTYLGDLYLWVVSTTIFSIYAYKSGKQRRLVTDLAIFLGITTALTFVLKMVFARPRPLCLGITVYDFESSFSYPSGHVSRVTGAFNILTKKNNKWRTVAVTATASVSLSRIVLGAHYLTDVVGGVLISLAAQRMSNLALSHINEDRARKTQPEDPRAEKRD
jgi:undecaprenyl-diphosphatase